LFKKWISIYIFILTGPFFGCAKEQACLNGIGTACFSNVISAPSPELPPSPLPVESSYRLELQSSLNIINPAIDPENNADQACANIPGHNGSDIWGWTSQSGREIAIMTKSGGTAFVDISNPSNPVHLADLRSHTGLGCLWNDVKVYQNYALIVSEAPDSGLQVFDLTKLPAANSPGLPIIYNQSDAHYALFGRAHNIVINEETGFAYAVGTTQTGNGYQSCDAGLHIISLANPLSPSFAGCVDANAYTEFETPFALAAQVQILSTSSRANGYAPLHLEGGDEYTHDAQCVVYQGPDIDYQGKELCFVSNGPLGQERINFNSYNIVDVSDKNAPRAVGMFLYDLLQSGYAHQGWLTEDHRYWIVNDETDELDHGLPTRSFVIDITDLENPSIRTIYSHYDKDQNPYGCTDHNLYIKADKMYQANYTCGLAVFDISQLNGDGPIEQSVVEIARFDTYPLNDNVGFEGGAWSVYPYFDSGNLVVSTIEGDLFILKQTE
jgi:hypothetical protein